MKTIPVNYHRRINFSYQFFQCFKVCDVHFADSRRIRSCKSCSDSYAELALLHELETFPSCVFKDFENCSTKETWNESSLSDVGIPDAPVINTVLSCLGILDDDHSFSAPRFSRSWPKNLETRGIIIIETKIFTYSYVKELSKSQPVPFDDYEMEIISQSTFITL